MTRYDLLYLVCLAFVLGCDAEMNTQNTPLVVEVTLGGSVNDVRGIQWPTRNNKLFEFFPFSNNEEPFDVTLTLPSGRKYSSRCRALFLNQKGQIVTNVVITPLEDLLQWSEAIDYCTTLGKELQLDTHPLYRLPERGEMSLKTPVDRISNRLDIDEGVSLFVELKRHISGDGYFASVEFSINYSEAPHAQTDADTLSIVDRS